MNGPQTPLATELKPATVSPPIPNIKAGSKRPEGLRDILVKNGPEAFAKAVRDRKGCMITDTTFRYD